MFIFSLECIFKTTKNKKKPTKHHATNVGDPEKRAPVSSGHLFSPYLDMYSPSSKFYFIVSLSGKDHVCVPARERLCVSVRVCLETGYVLAISNAYFLKLILKLK